MRCLVDDVYSSNRIFISPICFKMLSWADVSVHAISCYVSPRLLCMLSSEASMCRRMAFRFAVHHRIVPACQTYCDPRGSSTIQASGSGGSSYEVAAACWTSTKECARFGPVQFSIIFLRLNLPAIYFFNRLC